MRFGLFGVNFGTCGEPANAVRVAQAAEAVGFESLWTGEHLVLPDPRAGRSPLDPSVPMLDTVVALTLLATATTRVRLGSGIIVLPQRNPVVLAKELASLDVVSNGRLIVGVGAGYLEAEFAAIGVPMSERGGRMDDYIAAMRAIWSSAPAEFDGPFTTLSGVSARPWPVQQPGPPIVIGGATRATIRRAVTMGHGWYGFGLGIDNVKEWVTALREAQDQYERPAELGPLEISVTPTGPFDLGMTEQLAELGVDRLVVLPRPDAPREERHRQIGLDELLRNVEQVGAVIDRLG